MNQENNSPWEYKPDDTAPAAAGQSADDSQAPPPKPSRAGTVSWEAAEFIEQQHSAGWYLALAIATALLAAVVYLAAKDLIAVIIIIIVGVIVGVFASQKPGRASYEVTSSGLSVNGKLYGFGNYKSFSIIREGELSSVNLFPLKRLLPPLSAYFDPKDEPKITKAIGDSLPYEDRQLDGIERLTRRLRL